MRLFLALFLTSCKEETPPLQVAHPKVKIPKAFHDYQLPPKPVALEEVVENPPALPPTPAPQSPPKPSAHQLLQEARVKQVQENRAWRRQQVLQQRVKQTPLKNPQPTLRLKDPNYKQWDARIGEDISTLPVDRDRVLTEDMIIPMVLERSIHSQLPGRVTMVTSRDILSPTLKKVLLPAYTRLVCRYESLSKEGDTRLMLQCHRALLPDGASILLTEAMAADQMGRLGGIGEVDNRVWERYGAAFIVAGIAALASAGSNWAQASENPLGKSTSNAANNLSTQLGQLTATVLEEKIALVPVITLPAGSLMHLIPSTDIWLREPASVQGKDPNNVIQAGESHEENP